MSRTYTNKRILNSYKDKVGQEVFVGDWIVYGHALGRCAALKIGKVSSIYETIDDYDGTTQLRISVIGAEENWDDKLEVTKKGTLQFTDRTLKLDVNLVPQVYKDLIPYV